MTKTSTQKPHLSPPVAKVIGFNEGNGSSSSLELQVNIEGQDHVLVLPHGELHDYGLSNPAVVKELQKIRASIADGDASLFDSILALMKVFGAKMDDLIDAVKQNKNQ